ncbi:MAG TPA: TolC family protein, partial [Vicinamibacterales bacterium]|nr:TolC family protein [Vicinamibacterales bacterium]
MPRLSFTAAIIAALVLIPGAGFAQTPLTVEQAIQRALEANPSLAALRLTRAVRAAGVDVAAERPNPEVTYDLEKEAPRQAITATLPIELGGKRQSRMALANAGISTAESELDRFIVQLRGQVRRAYFAMSAADRRLGIAEGQRELAATIRDAAKTRFDAGDVAEIEIVQTELALADAENDVSGARGDIAAARAEFNALLGQPADTAFLLTDDPTTGELPSVASAVEEALSGSADLTVIDRQIVEQQFRRALARSMQKSDLTAGSSVTYDAEPEFTVGWRLSFSMTVPVFTRHRAGVMVEDRELTRLQAERVALAARIGADVTAAIARASAAREQMRRFETESLPRVQVLERMAQDAYNSGQSGLVALL